MVDSSEVAPARSGIERLRGRWDKRRIDWAEVLEGLYADESTWIRWQGVTTLRVDQALALHHHLDPDALHLGREDPKGRERIHQQFGLFRSGGPLEAFFTQLVWVAQHVRIRVLECVEVREPDWAASITTVESFARYVKGAAVFERPKEAQPSTPVAAGPWPAKYQTELQRYLVAANALWRTVGEGGSYVPGDLSTAPDVASFLRATGRVSGKMSAAMATMLRPEDLPKGRPPKRPRT